MAKRPTVTTVSARPSWYSANGRPEADQVEYWRPLGSAESCGAGTLRAGLPKVKTPLYHCKCMCTLLNIPPNTGNHTAVSYSLSPQWLTRLPAVSDSRPKDQSPQPSSPPHVPEPASPPASASHVSEPSRSGMAGHGPEQAFTFAPWPSLSLSLSLSLRLTPGASEGSRRQTGLD
jgi:hypothetical protein